MMSCEPAWSSAYSEDLWWRMVWQSELLVHPQQVIAQNLGVDQSIVSRTIQLFHTMKSVGKKPYPEERAFRKLNSSLPATYISPCSSTPRYSQYELQRELLGLLSVDVNISTIYHFLHETGFSRQKIIKLQQNEKKNFSLNMYPDTRSQMGPDYRGSTVTHFRHVQHNFTSNTLCTSTPQTSNTTIHVCLPHITLLTLHLQIDICIGLNHKFVLSRLCVVITYLCKNTREQAGCTQWLKLLITTAHKMCLGAFPFDNLTAKRCNKHFKGILCIQQTSRCTHPTAWTTVPSKIRTLTTKMLKR